MAILFQQNIRNALLQSGIIMAATSRSGNVATFAFTVYSGVQPSAATITSNWTNYNTTFLAHWPSVSILNLNNGANTTPQVIVLNTVSGNAVAANSGTASWVIMWPTNPSQATISGSSLPSTSFFVGPASSTTSATGIVQFTNPALVAGNSYAIDLISITATGGSV